MSKDQIPDDNRGYTDEQLKLAEHIARVEELKESYAFTRELLKKVTEGLIIYDSEDEIIYANLFIIEMLGLEIDEIYGEKIHEFISEEYRSLLDEKKLSGRGRGIEICCINKSGKQIPVRIKNGELPYKNDMLSFLFIEDLSRLHNYRKALKESGQLFRLMTGKSSEVISVINREGEIQYVSEPSERIFGYSPYELAGSSFYDFIHPEDRSNLEKKIRNWINNNVECTNTDYRFRSSDGSFIDVESTVCNIVHDPLINGLLLHTRDITDRKKAEEQAAHSQLYDTLITKLPNISLLKTRLQLEIVKVQERSQKNMFAVMSVGIDHFKKINNLYGTDTGDLILYKIGQRLKNSFRGDDLVAHYSGDSFVVLLSYIARSYDFKDIIRKTMGRLSEPFEMDGKKIDITASIGIAVFPNDGESVEQLINNSQAAMYRAKEEGHGNYHLFDSLMHRELIESLQLEDELKDAVVNGEFVAYYQPIFDSHGEIAGAETLIRWESPKRGLIPPGSFVPLIEKNGMIVEIGYMILKMACEDIKRWNDRGFKKTVAINFAPNQFKDPDLIENVERIILESGVNTDYLEFEITESGIMENAKEGLLKLFKIHTMGISIAMDDFGTGLSSLSNLILYPIDVLKIDKSFVDKLPSNEEAKIVVNSIISLADNLGYDVIAEGIETESQLNYLKDLKCGMFQGYYFERPMPADEFEKKYVDKSE